MKWLEICDRLLKNLAFEFSIATPVEGYLLFFEN
jgi:hypothetical protein